MNCRELIEYFQRFDSMEDVGVLVVDIEQRLHYKTGGYQLLDEMPVILLEATGTGPLDEVLEEVPNEGCSG